MNLNYKIGLRTIKSSIAVAVCVLIAYIIGNRDMIFFGGVASIICMQQHYKDTFKTGLHRFSGTLLGGVLGFITIMSGVYIPKYSNGINAIVIAVAVLVSIYLCNVFSLNEAASISCIVLLNVTANYDGSTMAFNAFRYVIFRVLFTLVGVVVSILVNRLICPYKNKPAEENHDILNDDSFEPQDDINNIKFIPGLRTIKTSICIIICVAFSYLIGNTEAIFFCSVASVLCMKQSHYESLSTGFFLFMGSVYGGLLGLLALFVSSFIPSQYSWIEMIIITAAVFLGIYGCNLVRANASTSITCIIMLKFISVFYESATTYKEITSFLVFVVLLFTLVGIVFAVLVNKFVYPLDASEKSI